jgi:hypothetical protein
LWEGGWGLSHDRILPIGTVQSENSDEIQITMSADEFRDLSVDFTEEYFEQADAGPGRADLSDLRRLAMSIPGEPGPYLMRERTALSADEVAVPDDAPVWRLRPHQKVGEVERVLFDEASERMTGLVVRRGFVFTKDVVLPSEKIVEVVAGIVRVELADDELDALEEFHPHD